MDYEPVARISALIDPEFPDSAEDERHWHDIITAKPGRLMLKWVVEEIRSEAVVGWGGLSHTLWNYHPNKYWVQATVHPEHRRRGIAHELYSLVEKEARDRNALCLWSAVREDDADGVQFLASNRFAPMRRVWFSRLDLIHLDLSRFPNRSQAMEEQGIRITTFGDEGTERAEVRRRLFELVQRGGADVPRMGEYTPITFEEFVAAEIEGPKALPSATFLAVKGEQFVGMTSLERVPGVPDTIGIGFTCTLPEFRGRGIASELKRRGVEFARKEGYRSLVTGNDSLNPRIWAINQRLGFQQERTWIQAQKTLGAT
ncbi:MAG: GNAT family N-acetyltransferase [Thermoplasmata archaeon]|nr:GNAT family N-acetyltransferase [Thermoplasmata archaeon]